jgi:hypothetical protein
MLVSTSDFLSVDAILSMVGIAIGVTIFLMQRRADSKINGMIETQFRHQELEKKYFGTRLLNNLQLVKKNHGKLAQYLADYLKDRSQASKNKIKNFSSFQSANLDGYVVPSLRSDLGRLIEFIDDLNLVDDLSVAFDDFPSLFKDFSFDSAMDGADSSISEKIEAANRRSEEVGSLISRFSKEIPKTV